MTVLRLILDVTDVDRDPALLLLRRLIDHVERHCLNIRVRLRQHTTDRRRQRRLPMVDVTHRPHVRSEEHTSELQSLMRISYAVFCLKKNTVSCTKKNNG